MRKYAADKPNVIHKRSATNHPPSRTAGERNELNCRDQPCSAPTTAPRVISDSFSNSKLGFDKHSSRSADHAREVRMRSAGCNAVGIDLKRQGQTAEHHQGPPSASGQDLPHFPARKRRVLLRKMTKKSNTNANGSIWPTLQVQGSVTGIGPTRNHARSHRQRSG